MKVKIVGSKLITILFTWCMFSAHATELFLRITSVAGEPLKQVGLGQPFIVELALQGAQSSQKTGSLFFSRGAAPQIKGLDKFNTRFSGTHMNMINGVGSMVYTYRVRIDKPGGYHIGPATLEHEQKTFTSNKVEFTVGDQEVLVTGRQVQKKDQTARLVASVDKKKIMLGEKIVYTLRYYYQDRTVQLKAIIPPQFNEFTAGKPQGPTEGKEVIQGQNYFYAQWQWDLFPTQAGSLTIPAAAADVEVLNAEHSLSVLSALLGGTVEAKQLFSPAVTVVVDPLPAYHEKVDAIGSFSSLYAHVDQTTVKEGEGFVLTLELTGEGNIEQIAVPVLKNLPESFKWYDSKNYMADTSAGRPRKRIFEYIVQGLQAGTFTIPSQKYTYFSSEKHAYKILETKPLEINVKQTALSKKRTALQEKISAGVEKKSAAHLLSLAPIDRILPVTNWSMPLWLFIFFVTVLCIIKGMWVLWGTPLHAQWYNKIRGTRSIYERARVQLKAAGEKEYDTIYRIFIELCAEKWHITVAQVPEQINNHLTASGWDAQTIEEFDEFMTLLAGAAYAQVHHAQHGTYIVERAYEWLEKLEKNDKKTKS